MDIDNEHIEYVKLEVKQGGRQRSVLGDDLSFPNGVTVEQWNLDDSEQLEERDEDGC